VFDIKDWKVIGEYVYDTQGGRHQAFCSPTRDVTIRDVFIKAGERVQIEASLKYSSEETAKLLNDAGMREIQKWSASTDEYSKTLSFLSLFQFQLGEATAHVNMQLFDSLVKGNSLLVIGQLVWRSTSYRVLGCMLIHLLF
jgi:hypothetical protein